MQEVTVYKSDNGVAFDNAFDALKEDLFAIVSNLADNAAVARKIVDGMCKDHEQVDALREIIARLYHAHPDQPQLAFDKPQTPPAPTSPKIVLDRNSPAIAKCMCVICATR